MQIETRECSIKFYYEKVLGKPVEKYYMPRPRKKKKIAGSSKRGRSNKNFKTDQ